MIVVKGCGNSVDLSNCTTRGETLYSYVLAETQCQEWREDDQAWNVGSCEVRENIIKIDKIITYNKMINVYLYKCSHLLHNFLKLQF